MIRKVRTNDVFINCPFDASYKPIFEAIHAHGGDSERAITEVRNWLCAASKRKGLPGGGAIEARYRQFRADLPALCSDLQRQETSLIFSDWAEMISLWLKASR